MQRIVITSLTLLFCALTHAADIRAAEPTPERTTSIRSAPNGQRPGSVLIYNVYTSSSTDAGLADTEFSVTNTNPTESISLHFFFVSTDGSVADAFLCLTPSQTATFLASDVDPGITGYVVAVAKAVNVGRDLGCPVGFNYLLGSQNVKFRSGHIAGLPAETFEALYRGALPGCSQTSVTADINFDGVRYSPAPRTLVLDKVSSLADGNSTMLVLNAIGGNLTTGVRPLGEIGGILYDDAESAFRFTSRVTPAGVQRRDILSDTFPLTTPVFTRAIPIGRTGWIKVMATEDRALVGAALAFHPGTATVRRAFTGGHNLAHLTYTTASFTVPIFPPSC